MSLKVKRKMLQKKYVYMTVEMYKSMCGILARKV